MNNPRQEEIVLIKNSEPESLNQVINPLNNLLTAIGSDIDHPPEKTRAMVYESEPDAEWATQEIQITVMESSS